MKKITQEQINIVLNIVYQTDIPAKILDSLKKFFQDLPEVEIKAIEVKEGDVPFDPKDLDKKS